MKWCYNFIFFSQAVSRFRNLSRLYRSHHLKQRRAETLRRGGMELFGFKRQLMYFTHSRNLVITRSDVGVNNASPYAIRLSFGSPPPSLTVNRSIQHRRSLWKKRNSSDVDVGYSSMLHARMRDRSIRNLNGRVNGFLFLAAECRAGFQVELGTLSNQLLAT